MFDVSSGCYFSSMSEKDYNSDDIEPGMSEGDVHSGPGGYEGMGYSGGYAADYLNKDEDSDEGESENDEDEDEANH